jgi:hypothetical protein
MGDGVVGRPKNGRRRSYCRHQVGPSLARPTHPSPMLCPASPIKHAPASETESPGRTCSFPGLLQDACRVVSTKSPMLLLSSSHYQSRTYTATALRLDARGSGGQCVYHPHGESALYILGQGCPAARLLSDVDGHAANTSTQPCLPQQFHLHFLAQLAPVSSISLMTQA